MERYGGPDGFLQFFTEMPESLRIIMAVIVFGAILYIFVVFFQSLFLWISNNRAEPMLQDSVVVNKRIDCRGGAETRSSYYITFEFNDKKRKEFQVSSVKFDRIGIGDKGRVCYQGTRFNGFNRVVGDRPKIKITI